MLFADDTRPLINHGKNIWVKTNIQLHFYKWERVIFFFQWIKTSFSESRFQLWGPPDSKVDVYSTSLFLRSFGGLLARLSIHRLVPDYSSTQVFFVLAFFFAEKVVQYFLLMKNGLKENLLLIDFGNNVIHVCIPFFSERIRGQFGRFKCPP